MIIRVENAAPPAYLTQMRLTALRLFMLLAVMLMPFGMSAAPAASIHQEQMNAMAAGHCDDSGSSPTTNSMLADCAMACSAALPAADLEPVLSHPVARIVCEPAITATLAGIEMEIATPPPRPLRAS